METENDCEIKRARDAIQMIQTLQTMIDVSADRLTGLRTQCLTSAELTQQEIRTLEGKLVKHFSKQLVIKAKFGEELKKDLGNVPSLELWLKVVGLTQEAIEAVCGRVPSLESLRERSDRELGTLLPQARDEEVRRLCRAMHRLRSYTDALARGESANEMPLYWDSWEKQRARVRGSNASDVKDERKKFGTPVSRRRGNNHLPAPPACPAAALLAKSRSHESQLSLKPDTGDHCSEMSQSLNASEASPPSTPRERPYHNNRVQHNNTQQWWQGSGASPVSPGGTGVAAAGTNRGPGHMAHDIAHRFRRSFSVLMPACDYCEKQIFGNGLKCKECKFRCHKECERKVPPSCGLTPELVNAFRESVHKESGYYPVWSNIIGSQKPRRKKPDTIQNHIGLYSTGGRDSSSTSSCNSSTPSSPAPAQLSHPAHSAHPSHPAHNAHPPLTHHAPVNNAAVPTHHFSFPEVKSQISSANHTPIQSPARITNNVKEKEDFTSSVKSDGSAAASLSGSASTDSGGAGVRTHSLDNGDPRWPRQNSLSMKEWDIPYDELKLQEALGTGRFGTVYRGVWHGPVAVKLLHITSALSMKEWDIPYDELKLQEALGTGRFGTVYRGVWHGPVAVKLLHLPTHQQLDTFKHEVATFRKTRHENLVLFMGACMKPPKLAIVTSLVNGSTLYQHIHLRKDKFTPNRSVIVAQQISQGMGYLHARGIIHKDLKTKNIFLENGKVVITDFGIFSVTKLCFGNNARGDSLGIPAGWLCYLAPELVRALRPHASLHLPFSKHTDVYAFGTVVYELLCGELPFSGERAEAVIWQVGTGVKQSLAALHASRDMKEIVSQCWAYNQKDRPTFTALLASVEKLPRKRLARSPSHPLHLSRSADALL